MNFNPINYPFTFTQAEWVTRCHPWHGHIPFAFFLASAIKPRTYVELGVALGDSYCAFCQAVKALSLNTRCVGIDSWEGDKHAGIFTPNEFLPELRAHHDVRYSEFSTLRQSYFDEALPDFSDGLIDLLHIDGLHTYEAVKHDFDTWLPKMSDWGVILFHDTNVREKDFGVYQLWAELSSRYPHFEFLHSYGLGVLGVGTSLPEALAPLFQATGQEVDNIRTFFDYLGSYTHEKFRLSTALLAEQARPQVSEPEYSRLTEEIRINRLELEKARAVLDDYDRSRALKLARKAWDIRNFISPRR